MTAIPGGQPIMGAALAALGSLLDERKQALAERQLRFLHRYAMGVELRRSERGTYSCAIDHMVFGASTAAGAIDSAYEHLLRRLNISVRPVPKAGEK